MIIRKPTKIELKPEDDFEEYENYREEQTQALNKMNRNSEAQLGIGQFGSEFGIGITGPNRLFINNYPLGGNDRSFMGESYQPNFQSGFSNELNFRYLNPSSVHSSCISGSSGNNYSQNNNHASFDRSQQESRSAEGGQINQLFSALIGGQGLGLVRPSHTGSTSSTQNPNPLPSLNNSN